MKYRALYKTLSYRILGSLGTVIIALLATGEVNISLGIGLADLVFKMIAYYFHEKLWESVS